MRKTTPTEQLRIHYESLFGTCAMNNSGRPTPHYLQYLETVAVRRLNIHKFAVKFMKYREMIKETRENDNIRN